jgi:hypothetical protein
MTKARLRLLGSGNSSSGSSNNNNSGRRISCCCDCDLAKKVRIPRKQFTGRATHAATRQIPGISRQYEQLPGCANNLARALNYTLYLLCTAMAMKLQQLFIAIVAAHRCATAKRVEYELLLGFRLFRNT